MSLVAWLLVILAHAGTPPAPKLEVVYKTPPVNAAGSCYPSGLLVVAVQRPGTRSASTAWVLDHGSASDPKGKPGLTHLVEHLWYRSSADGGPDLWHATDGVTQLGLTDTDETMFVATAATEDLTRLVALHSRLLVDPLRGVTPEAFAAERDIVRQEAYYRGEHGEKEALRLVQSALYPDGHPYASVIATADDLARLAFTDAQSHARAIFHANGTTLYVEADLPPERILALVDAGLPDVIAVGPGSTCDRTIAPSPPTLPRTPEMVVARGPVWRTKVYAAWSTPPLDRSAEARVAVAERAVERAILDRARFNSDFYTDGFFDLGVRCRHAPHRLAWQVTCVLDAPPALPPDTVARLVRQTLPKVGEWLAPMALATVDRDSVRSLDVAKEAHALASTWLWDDASQGDDAVAERAAFTHDTDEVTLLDTRLAGLASVDRASVAAFVDEWLTERRMALAAVVPGPAPRLETRRIDGRAILDTTASTPWSAPPDPDGLASWTLANGVRVWTLRAAAPISAVETVFPGGFMRDPQPGTDEVVETVATYQLPIDLDVLATRGGVRAAHSFDAWADRLVASSTAENLDTALWTVRAMVDGQRLDAMGGRQAALDSVLGEIAQTAGDRPWAMSSAAQADLLFGRHRAGLSWWDRNRAARDVDWSTARAWQESVYRPERAHLVVVSPHPPEALAPLAERYLGRMRARSASAPMVPANAARLPSPPARRALALEYDAPVSRADVRCRVPGFGPETAAALLVMDEATSRAAWDSLRSGGGTYAPEVGLASYAPNAGLLSIAADVGAADGGKAAGASVDILRRLASGEEEAFVRAAGRRARADWGRAFDSAPSAFTVLDWAATWGLEPTQLARLGDEILAVDARQVADLLVDCVGHEVISVIGPDAATSLREAGFEAEPYDWLADHERRCASVR